MTNVSITDDRKGKHQSVTVELDRWGDGFHVQVTGYGYTEEEARANFADKAKAASLLIAQAALLHGVFHS